jgi:hypothetical protein
MPPFGPEAEVVSILSKENRKCKPELRIDWLLVRLVYFPIFHDAGDLVVTGSEARRAFFIRR